MWIITELEKKKEYHYWSVTVNIQIEMTTQQAHVVTTLSTSKQRCINVKKRRRVLTVKSFDSHPDIFATFSSFVEWPFCFFGPLRTLTFRYWHHCGRRHCNRCLDRHPGPHTLLLRSQLLTGKSTLRYRARGGRGWRKQRWYPPYLTAI